jgi:hypothetical protein
MAGQVKEIVQGAQGPGDADGIVETRRKSDVTRDDLRMQSMAVLCKRGEGAGAGRLVPLHRHAVSPSVRLPNFQLVLCFQGGKM